MAFAAVGVQPRWAGLFSFLENISISLWRRGGMKRPAAPLKGSMHSPAMGHAGSRTLCFPRETQPAGVCRASRQRKRNRNFPVPEKASDTQARPADFFPNTGGEAVSSRTLALRHRNAHRRKGSKSLYFVSIIHAPAPGRKPLLFTKLIAGIQHISQQQHTGLWRRFQNGKVRSILSLQLYRIFCYDCTRGGRRIVPPVLPENRRTDSTDKKEEP